MVAGARQPSVDSPPAPAVVLTRATQGAADRLGLQNKALAQIIGVSAASVSRLGDTRLIDPSKKEGELAILFLRLFRSLDSLLGGDEEACRKWLHADNTHLEGIPAQMIESVQGLVRVAEYVDAMRGKV